MLKALVKGQRDPETLADLALGTLRHKRARLVAALEGPLLEHHCFLREQMLEDLEHTEERIRAVEQEAGAVRGPFEDALRRLDAIPGGEPDRRLQSVGGVRR